jgi:hypothetical protein
MVPAFRGSSPCGRDLNMITLRSRIYSSSKLFILASATMMSSVLSPTVSAQNAVVARPPVSPEAMAVHVLAKRPVAKSVAIDVVESAAGVNSEQGPGAGPRDLGQPGCDLFPAPASVGTNVGLSYFGPPPSTVNPSLVGPVQLLNTGRVDAIAGTITVPATSVGVAVLAVPSLPCKVNATPI